ncbi:flagellar biosynthesis protein FlhA [Roseospirillum parvum]|uniref:Flagellar biosynthesis protein FlhA n=1 Tax=Roseospirillum parvum TaxID=83401 RepID=A0A1G7W9H1_9PROT|nr:flagellar biosynthesis protein FlhA [Roseospirillum parvum]SDG68606.1 flagellar biosynthesis protein FlhA [Roseospirillum parvum]
MADDPSSGGASPDTDTAAGGFDFQAFGKRAQDALKRGDLGFAAAIIAVLAVLILPMPAWLLDIMLAMSLTFSVLVLMTVIFISRAVEFNAFPVVLLIATLLRLSLNLASTRLILAEGHQGTDAAGQVIEAFGGFIMGGNFVIGVIVFAILVLVNFMVITKGATRIAEVTARFTLDALPGKQMAIDADLSTGLIDEPEARRRRLELQNESDFFGAMDGASKFVRGDAVAGIIITAINIVGGMIIGMVQNDLTFAEAANTYTRLTVGDGLVSQIPALIVSVGAGLMVSKSGLTEATDTALVGQFTNYPKALGMSSGMALLLALVPGTPFLPFVLLAGVTGTAAWYAGRQQDRVKAAADAEAVELERQQIPITEEPISAALKIDLVRLELGYGLLPMINDTNTRLTDQIKALRRALAQDMGFVMPSVRIQDNMQLPANAYAIHIKDVEAGRGDLRPAMLLVMDPRGEDITLPGERTREPTFGLPAVWIDPAAREEALFRGYTVVDPPTVITTHLTEVVRDNMQELLSYAETQKLLDELDKDQQKLIADMVPAQITVSGIQRVLQNLLAERISIRDLPTILEGISEACGMTRNIMLITEHVRGRLSRQLSDAAADDEDIVPLVTLTPEWEQAFAESLIGQGEERQLAMAPSKLQEFIVAVRQTFERFAMQGETPVLLTSPSIRPYVRSIVERFRPMTVVMSQNEIHPKARIKTLGQI